MRIGLSPNFTVGYADETGDKLARELLRAYNANPAAPVAERSFDAEQVARTWVRKVLQDAERIATQEGTLGAARLRAMAEGE